MNKGRFKLAGITLWGLQEDVPREHGRGIPGEQPSRF
jgi:hypothetical protein